MLCTYPNSSNTLTLCTPLTYTPYLSHKHTLIRIAPRRRESLETRGLMGGPADSADLVMAEALRRIRRPSAEMFTAKAAAKRRGYEDLALNLDPKKRRSFTLVNGERKQVRSTLVVRSGRAPDPWVRGLRYRLCIASVTGSHPRAMRACTPTRTCTPLIRVPRASVSRASQSSTTIITWWKFSAAGWTMMTRPKRCRTRDTCSRSMTRRAMFSGVPL